MFVSFTKSTYSSKKLLHKLDELVRKIHRILVYFNSTLFIQIFIPRKIRVSLISLNSSSQNTRNIEIYTLYTPQIHTIPPIPFVIRSSFHLQIRGQNPGIIFREHKHTSRKKRKEFDELDKQ